MYEIIIGRKEGDRKKWGTKGTILLGKHYVKMGQTTSLSNKIFLDVTSSHVVFVCGKRGGGKCLDGDTLITLEDGSQAKIKDIANDNKSIISLNNDLKIISAAKTNFYERTVNRMLSLRLRSGREIKLTPEHPLLTVKGWIPADKLHIGSRIAAPRKIDTYGNEYLEEHKVKLLSYLISEGHISNNFVLFSNKDEKIISDFKEAIKDFDDSLTVKNHSKDYCFRVSANVKRTVSKAKRDIKGRFTEGSRFEKSSIKKYLEELGLYSRLSGDKFVPDCILKGTKHNITLFLNRLFSCDGTIYKDNNTGCWRISYASKSEQLIRQVQSLLLRFEITGIIRKKTINGHKSFELDIRGEGIYNFLNNIGFFGRKEKRADKAIKEVVVIRRNPNLDTIPKEIWDIYRPDNWANVGRTLNYTISKAARSSINYSVSRQKLLAIAQADENDLMLKMASSDIYWDEIIAVEEVLGSQKVYDITVPKHHNFVANDLIVHNSYTMGAIAEGMANLPDEIKKNLSVIMLDTMGIYWTMKYPNHKDKDLLNEWGLKDQGLDVSIYTPTGYFNAYKDKGIPTDKPFAIRTADLEPSEWCMTLGFEQYSAHGILIERIIRKLKKTGKSYSIENIIELVKKDEKSEGIVKDAVENTFTSIIEWGLFDTEGTSIEELAKPGQVTVLDVSCYATQAGASGLRALVIGLVSEKLFLQRMIARKDEEYKTINKSLHFFDSDDEQEEKMPLVWLVIDEAHEFLPNQGKTVASDPLITILREGRQPGISLILATQQPGKIHTDVMTQSDTVISHRLTAKIDVDALGTLMQSYMRDGLNKYLDNLPRVSGAAIILDDANERMYPMRVRPRFTWHGGSSPSAMPQKDKTFDF